MHALLLHGAGGGGWEWAIWRQVFAAHAIDAHAVDLRPVAAGLAATGLDDYIDQARAAALSLPGPPVLVGASLGGLVALALAGQLACRACVLVNPVPPAPEAALLPAREPWPSIVPWRGRASLAGTRRALVDADDASALFAFRHWRDESGQVLNEAHAGRTLRRPDAPLLVMVSADDEDVPPLLGKTLAQRLGAPWLQVPGGHVSPLLGRRAAAAALAVVGWLKASL